MNTQGLPDVSREFISLVDKRLVIGAAFSEELLNNFYTTEEVGLLNQGVSPQELQTLNDLFGREYIVSHYVAIRERLQTYNNLLQKIGVQGGVFGAGGFLTEPYNEQWKYIGRDLYPYNTRVDNGIVVDLFSQNHANLLSYKLADENSDYQKERYGDGYVFNPQSVVYVDLYNRDRKDEMREINQFYIQDDSLRFVSLLPDDSVHYIISGVDFYIINSMSILGKDYLNYLVKEIARTTAKGGIVTGVNFEENELLVKKGMKKLDLPQFGLSKIYCYEKE